jgi:hypothetical protein
MGPSTRRIYLQDAATPCVFESVFAIITTQQSSYLIFDVIVGMVCNYACDDTLKMTYGSTNPPYPAADLDKIPNERKDDKRHPNNKVVTNETKQEYGFRVSRVIINVLT